jgi:hypothetical protein
MVPLRSTTLALSMLLLTFSNVEWNTTDPTGHSNKDKGKETFRKLIYIYI